MQYPEFVFLLRISVTSLGKHCCLIVDSFEKNYRDPKTCLCFVKGAVGGPESKDEAKIAHEVVSGPMMVFPWRSYVKYFT